MLFDLVDPVPPDVPNSSQPSRFYIFDDHEAVVRMIMIGLSKLATCFSQRLAFSEDQLEDSISVRYFGDLKCIYDHLVEVSDATLPHSTTDKFLCQ